MIDYINGLDYPVTKPHITKDNWYVLSMSVFNGFIFSSFPIDKDSIIIENIRNRSFLLSKVSFPSISNQFYWGLFSSSENIDTAFNDFVGILCGKSLYQMTLSY